MPHDQKFQLKLIEFKNKCNIKQDQMFVYCYRVSIVNIWKIYFWMCGAI